ncbi:two-component system response regulator [Paramagnetospirillum kuznetsovii]|uniref:Two-component system response regulator n=1 Tax=Paramagnetospirillum kuznetsovii TaxID=2053833 RepID=A0A364NZV7_9PROT|nr:response regulator [Paramagnetospirillum kuznetsovii]RAU22622.1 two-component system response regulator [Paramagnetospirillum kuznetsovii]
MSKNPHVLLVEDNEDDVELALHAFRGSAMSPDITVVRDGEEALDYLFATGRHAVKPSRELPALVLLDLQLPGIGGLEVLRRLRERPETKRVPVVILTTSDDQNDIIGGYDRGVNSYIRKPVGYADFAQMVKQLEHYWLVTNVAPPA